MIALSSDRRNAACIAVQICQRLSSQRRPRAAAESCTCAVVDFVGWTPAMQLARSAPECRCTVVRLPVSGLPSTQLISVSVVLTGSAARRSSRFAIRIGAPGGVDDVGLFFQWDLYFLSSW